MNFLLEIGTEEIPHWMIPGALDQLRKMNLFGALPRVDATPRRLVVQASGVLSTTSETSEVALGPAPPPGYSAASGPPTDAATLGWIQKNRLQITDIFLRETPKGWRWAVTKVEPGRPTIGVLAKLLPGFILGIQWPKSMYWTAKDGPRSIRPIRWIVALLGDEVIPFEIAGVKSGNVTRGHRQLGSSSIPVTIENYEGELRKNFVILSSHERRHKIETEASALGAKIDPDLLETLTFITEYPAAIRGEFDPAFLELPAEVLTTVMRHHQKYFSVEPVAGRLAPNFVAVMNTSGDPEGLVKRGNERVLKARFNDARFFWDVDQQKKLADRVQDLKKVTFQAKLGSYFEKTARVVALVKELGGDEHAERAAQLAKTDLTTEMVKEFTELQGVVGGLYARAQGEPEPVWKAIYEHYQPVNMEDSIPETREGQIVSLADKLDTLRECFQVGMIPSGSKDPFALRRAAQGVVKILVEAKLPYDFYPLFASPLTDFMMERVQHYFREVRGFKYDEVNAVLATSRGTLTDVEARLIALSEVRPTADFEPLAASFKRIRNILKQANFEPNGKLQERLIEPGEERELFDAYQIVQKEIQGVGYVRALERIASLRPYVDRFFDKVLVNAKDPEVRINRLTLLSDLLTEFSTIADFSEIVTSGDQK
jgi:glycyl-tRNA synthetase beta chain